MITRRGGVVEERSMEERILECERRCRAQGLPFTVQRRAVLKTVLGLDNHPTADQVHAALCERLPGVSRATVYRTLETLARLGAITKACHPGSAVRYDPRTELHHHLICKACDAVIDIRDEGLDALRIPDTERFGFEVHDFRVQLRGLCRDCRTKEKSR